MKKSSQIISPTVLHKAVVVDLTKTNHSKLISVLNFLYENLYFSLYNEVLNNPKIQPHLFNKEDYLQSHRGNFKKALGVMMNKAHLKWNLSQKERAFRMLAEFVRQNFKSLLYKVQISEILDKYQFDYTSDETKEKIRKEFIELNLFPTTAEINNICRSKKVIKKEDWLEKELNFILDFTTQDIQTISQPNLDKAIYQIFDFNPKTKEWIEIDFTSFIPTYFKKEVDNLIQQGLFIKYTKPKFFRDENKNWKIAITIEFKPEKNNISTKNKYEKVLGVDLGRVKPFSAIAINTSSKEIISYEINCKKEAKKVKEKLDKTAFHLKNIYRKLNQYKKLLHKPKEIKDNNNTFFENITAKQTRLIQEKRFLRRKNKELRKRLAYLCARDLLKQIEKLGVSLVKFERLNWVEHTGGKWDFSQMQDIMEAKLHEKGISTCKVSASFTSSQNPFKKQFYLGVKNNDRSVVFKTKKGAYSIDRDELAAINIALKPLTLKSRNNNENEKQNSYLKQERLVLDFYQNINSKQIKSFKVLKL